MGYYCCMRFISYKFERAVYRLVSRSSSKGLWDFLKIDNFHDITYKNLLRGTNL